VSWLPIPPTTVMNASPTFMHPSSGRRLGEAATGRRGRLRRRAVALSIDRDLACPSPASGIRDMYGIEVGSGENDALIIAATVCNDEMAGH
jgi:hypothetical protein